VLGSLPNSLKVGTPINDNSLLKFAEGRIKAVAKQFALSPVPIAA